MRFFSLRFAALSMRDFYTCGLPVGSPWFFLPWMLGKSLKADVPVPVIYTLDNPRPLGDLVNTVGGSFLVSNRMAEIVEQLTSSIEHFPAEIFFEDQKVADDYSTVNFTRTCPCMDWDLSEYEADPDMPDAVSECRKLVLDPAKIPQDAHIFRLHETGVDILVSEHGRALMEDAGLTDIEFVEVGVRRP